MNVLIALGQRIHAAVGQLFSGRWTSALTVLAASAGLAALVYFGWQRYGQKVVSNERFRIAVDRVEISPVPHWIQSDVKADVVRDGSLAGTSLLEPEITIQIADAFSLHTWVKRVTRVSKQPTGRVVVDLVFREPVATVKVPGGVFPIDADGVLLPVDGFSPESARKFAHIDVGDTWPLGMVGTSWGDPRVAGAAQIAAAFGSSWSRLGLYWIGSAQVESGVTGEPPTFDLVTRNGLRIRWGHAPQREDQAEARAADKIARLRQFIDEGGPLDGLRGDIEIDLRDRTQIRVAPRTASGVTMEPTR